MRSRVVPVCLGAALALGVATAAAAGQHPSGGPPSGAAVHVPILPPGVFVRVVNAAAGPVGIDARHLVWESGPIESDAFQPSLHDRNLATGATKVIATNVNPLFGLASTSRYVFYAQTAGRRVSVVRVSHDGTGSRVIATNLATPIASRGDIVAWGEQVGSSQMIIATDVSRRHTWTIARVPNCTKVGCYRLDTVTVADGGVVFTRDAVGPHASLVIRRSFGSTSTQAVAIPNDPQPNLVPSSSGALYEVLSKGWFRWDFGSSRPRPVTFADTPIEQLIRYEQGRWYWQVRKGCNIEIRSTGVPAGTALVAPPRSMTKSPFGPTCTQLSAFIWSGRQAIASWAIAPEAAESSHSDTGLRGAIVAGKPTSTGGQHP